MKQGRVISLAPPGPAVPPPWMGHSHLSSLQEDHQVESHSLLTPAVFLEVRILEHCLNSLTYPTVPEMGHGG